MKLYQSIARLWNAHQACVKAGNGVWADKHLERLQALVKEHMPSGSGIDMATTFGEDSKENKLIFRLSFHHMNESGMYDGWTDHSVVVTPSLVFDFDLKVTGRDRNDIKNYLGDTYAEALRQDIAE